MPLRIALVLTYPLYHESPGFTTDQWLNRPDREREIAGLLARMGHRVELWAVAGKKRTVTRSAGGDKSYTLRIFKATREEKKTRYHFSDDLVEYARHFAGDLHILKGVDGGVGTRLLRGYLCRGKACRPFVFIIGGGYYSGYVPRAGAVFYETEAQEQMLHFPGWRFWRKPVPAGNLVRLPKWIDTDLFRPLENETGQWDILAAGRLMSGYKNYDALGPLSRHFRTAAAGDGPDASRLRSRYPGVCWLGHIPNRELPSCYNRARLFMHTGLRDFYPRVIAEAMACGTPCAAFAGSIAADVLPPGCGLLVKRNDFIRPIRELLENETRLLEMGRRAREHALKNAGKDACQKAIKEMFRLLEKKKLIK